MFPIIWSVKILNVWRAVASFLSSRLPHCGLALLRESPWDRRQNKCHVCPCPGGAGIGGLQREKEENFHGGVSVLVVNHRSAGTSPDGGVSNATLVPLPFLARKFARCLSTVSPAGPTRQKQTRASGLACSGGGPKGTSADSRRCSPREVAGPCSRSWGSRSRSGRWDPRGQSSVCPALGRRGAGRCRSRPSRTAADHPFTQAQADRLIRQRDHPAPLGAANNLAPTLLGRTAEHQDVVVQLVDNPPGERGAMLGRPELGRAIGPAGVDHDHPAVAAQAQSLPHLFGQFLLQPR